METDFADAKGHSPTYQGSPSITPTGNPAPYGTKCGSFGTAGWVKFPDSSDWNLTTGEFTVEGWVRPAVGDLGAVEHLMVEHRIGGDGYTFGFHNGKLRFSISTGGFFFIGNTVLTAGVPIHFAFCKSGTTVTIFINGTVDKTGPFAYTAPDVAAMLSIGGDTRYGGIQKFDGKLKDLRITKGVCRYTAPFTVPADFYPTS